MKKTLLSVGAALAVIGSAAAVGPDTCNPEKYVWVEKDELCIPKNPCKSKSDVIRKAYCNTTFKNVQLGNWRQGRVVAEAYSKRYLGTDITNANDMYYDKDTSLFGQDYLPAKLSDGGYVVFEFDDLADIAGGDKYDGAAEAACLIHGGRYGTQAMGDGGETLIGLYCSGVSESDCKAVSSLASEILSNSALFTGEYHANDLSHMQHMNVCALFAGK